MIFYPYFGGGRLGGHSCKTFIIYDSILYLIENQNESDLIALQLFINTGMIPVKIIKSLRMA